MPLSVNAILNKPDKSSRDIGLLLLYYGKATLENKKDKFPISLAEIGALSQKLTYRADKYKYDVLEAFYDAITTERLKAYDNARRIAGGASILKLYIRSIDEHSKQESLLYSMPLSLTPTGRKNYTEATRAAAEAKSYSFYEILQSYLYSYLKLYKAEPLTVPQSILNGFSLSDRPIKEKSVKEQYRKTYKTAYFCTAEDPQGKDVKSNFPGFEKFADFLTANIKHYKLSKVEIESLLQTIHNTDRAYYTDNLDELKQGIEELRRINLIGKDEAPELDTPDRLKEWYANIIREFENNDRTALKGYFREEPKEITPQVTIFSLLLASLTACTTPGREHNPTGLIFQNDPRTQAKQLRELKAAAPELFEALCDQIKHDIPSFAELTEAELLKATIKGKTLKALNNAIMRDKFANITFADIREYILTSKNTSYLEKRQAQTGIALYTLEYKNTSSYMLSTLATEYTYNPSMPEPHTSINDLTEKEIAAIYKSEIYRPLKWVLSYNVFIDICAAALNVPFMTSAEFKEIPFIMMNIYALNREIYSAYRNLQGEEREKAEKEKKFKAMFKPVDPDTAHPGAELMAAITKVFDAALEKKQGAEWIKKAPRIIQEIADNIF